jgi:hypothetical protein
VTGEVTKDGYPLYKKRSKTMEPIWIILYLVIASTLINVLVITRQRKANLARRRLSWMLAITGLAVLIVLTVFTQMM